MGKITKEEFEKNWIATTGCRVAELIQRYGFAPVPCDCGESHCEGWRMLTKEQRERETEDKERAGPKLKALSVESVINFLKAVNARGVVVMVFSDNRYGMTSYGRNKADFEAMKSFTDALTVLLGAGDLQNPWPDSQEPLSLVR